MKYCRKCRAVLQTANGAQKHIDRWHGGDSYLLSGMVAVADKSNRTIMFRRQYYALGGEEA